MQTEQPIKTYVRLKPTAPDQKSLLKTDPRHIFIPKNKEQYEYDAVFNGNASNQTLFQSTILPIIPSILQGYNSCILAYGQTYSGKTYSLKGDESNPGIIPLIIKQIFNRINRQKLKAKILISYYQIYNENIIDLLNDLSTNPPKYLEIREDNKKNVNVVDLVQQQVNNEMESVYFYEQGQKRRTFACNNINSRSSRSHAIFKIMLDIAINMELSTSTISMVDLAGSESISRTNAVGILKKESQNINKSLLALTNVIRGMSEKNSYVNFRDSKLTRILQPCLTNNSKSIIICTVQQTEDCLSETINTLRFGLAANKIRVAVKRNVMSNEIEVKDNELDLILQQERQMRREAEKESTLKTIQITGYKQKLKNCEKLITQLKHQLLSEQNQNLNKDLMIQQLKLETNKLNENSNNIFQQEKSYIQNYQQELKKLKDTLAEKNLTIKSLQKDVMQLERNERTLLDKIHKYERELQQLNSTMGKDSQTHFKNKNHLQTLNNSNSLEVQNQNRNETFHQMANPIPQRGSHLQNPYTIEKVIQLSTRILDMKLQLNQYIQANAELQSQVNTLNQQIEQIKSDKHAVQEDLRSEVSRNSDTNKPITARQLQKMKRQIKQLKRITDDLKKKQIKYLKILKKNAKNHIEELEGFNLYIEKNFPNPDTLFQMLMQEPPEDYAPRLNEEFNHDG